MLAQQSDGFEMDETADGMICSSADVIRNGSFRSSVRAVRWP